MISRTHTELDVVAVTEASAGRGPGKSQRALCLQVISSRSVREAVSKKYGVASTQAHTGKHTHMYTHTETWGRRNSHTPQISVLLATYTRKRISTAHAVMSGISIKQSWPGKQTIWGTLGDTTGLSRDKLTQHSHEICLAWNEHQILESSENNPNLPHSQRAVRKPRETKAEILCLNIHPSNCSQDAPKVQMALKNCRNRA